MSKKIFHKILIYISLFLFSFFFNFYYGYRGVLPIDSFLIFDSGYFVLEGNYPFRDFWTVTGPLLDYIQSIFFYIFDVSWLSYVIHSSLMNFLLAIFTYLFCINLGLNKIYSIIFSLSASILAYPSVGTPFPDHHSFIFSVISVFFMIFADIKKKNYYYFFVSLFLFLSFLSKQVNSFYLIIFFSTFFLYDFIISKRKNLKKIYYFFLGIIVSTFIFIIFLKLTKTPIINFLVQYILYPFTIGNTRISVLNFDFGTLIGQFKFIYLSLIPATVIFFKNFILKKNKTTNTSEIYIFIIFIGSILIFIYCQLLTKNQVLIFSLIPICLAFSQKFVEKYYYKKYLIYLIMIVCVYATAKYHIRFNENKKFMELEKIYINNSVDGSKIDNSFSGLNWITHLYPQNSELEAKLLKESVDVIKFDKSKKIIITDYQFISAITKNKISSPNKWHDMVSVPSKSNKFFQNYKNFFFSKLEKNKIDKIYIVGSYKEIFLTKLLTKKDCADRVEINELLSSYNIKNCKELNY